jgi:hypothetical protein
MACTNDRFRNGVDSRHVPILGALGTDLERFSLDRRNALPTTVLHLVGRNRRVDQGFAPKSWVPQREVAEYAEEPPPATLVVESRPAF